MSTILISEAYYGKNPLLIQIENEVEYIRKQCLNDFNYNPNFTKENKKIEQLFTQLFNVEAFLINWDVSKIAANAMTWPVGMLFFSKYSTFEIDKKGKYGIRFKEPDGKKMILVSSTSLFTLTKLTAAEWVAVALHEIGHNFFISPYQFIITKFFILRDILYMLGSLGTINNPIQFWKTFKMLVLEIVYGNANLRSVVLKARDKLSESEIKVLLEMGILIKQMLEFMLEILMLPFYATSGIILRTGASIKKLFLIPLTIITRGYQNEKFADNFATSFGYGVEIASVAAKFNKIGSTGLSEKIIMNIPIYRVFYSTITFFADSIENLGAPHPSNYTRIIDQAKKLRSDLKDSGLDKRQIKEIENQITQIEEIYEEAYSSNLMENHQYNEYIRNCILLRIFNKKPEDVREIFFKSRNYDKMD